MNKKNIRSKYIKKRAEVTASQLDDLSLHIANKLLEIEIWDKEYYHIFLPIEGKAEVNTEYVINILAGKDKYIILPKSDFKNSTLINILLTDSTLIKSNNQGIPEPINGIEIEPEKIDVVFVPLLAFDSSGNRIGYGKGFYDRFLKNCRPETLKIGLSLFEAEENISDLNEFDIPLDYCATPNKLYIFNSIPKKLVTLLVDSIFLEGSLAKYFLIEENKNTYTSANSHIGKIENWIKKVK